MRKRLYRNPVPFAGFQTTLKYTGSASMSPCAADSFSAVGAAFGAHTYATGALSPILMLAYVAEIKAESQIEVGRLTWPIAAGTPQTGEFKAESTTISDQYGAASASNVIISAESKIKLGDLPPAVDMAAFPASV
jgi:hypothetical protein